MPLEEQQSWHYDTPTSLSIRRPDQATSKCLGLHADRPTGLGPRSQVTGISDFFLCNASAFDVWGGSIRSLNYDTGHLFLGIATSLKCRYGFDLAIKYQLRSYG